MLFYFHFSALILLATIYIFYTIPLQAATSLLDPKTMNQLIPGYSEWLDSIPWFKGLYSGLASGLIFTIFFSICPAMFKFIANFGSNATSQFHAEYTAMQVRFSHALLYRDTPAPLCVTHHVLPFFSTFGGSMWSRPSGGTR